MQDKCTLTGTIILQTEDKKGNIRKRIEFTNAITNPFLKHMLARTMSVSPISGVMRGQTGKDSGTSPTGQHLSILATGTWGIYALTDTAGDIQGTTRLAPYIRSVSATADQNRLTNNVLFYNVGGGSNEEGPAIMAAVDARSGYNFDQERNQFTMEYIRSAGRGYIKSVVVGRAHTSPTAVQGVRLGELLAAAQTPAWINNRTGTAVEHTPDNTVLWKTATSGDVRFIDLYNREVLGGAEVPEGRTELTAGNIGNILNTAGVGAAGSVIANGNPYRVDHHRVVYSTGDVVAEAIEIKLTIWTTAADPPRQPVTPPVNNVTTGITGATPPAITGWNKTILTNQIILRIPVEAGTTALDYHPVTVYNPQNKTVEAFVAVSHGSFSTTRHGARVYRVVFGNLPETQTVAEVPRDLLNGITITRHDLGVWHIVPSAPALGQGLGYLEFSDTAQPDRYYLPCFAHVDKDDGTLVPMGTPDFCPGYIIPYAIGSTHNSSNTRGVGDTVGNWIARSADAGAGIGTSTGQDGQNTATSGGGGSITPVRTSKGIAFCLYDTPAPHYVDISQVISGSQVPQNLWDDPVRGFFKDHDDLLRIMYTYTLSPCDH